MNTPTYKTSKAPCFLRSLEAVLAGGSRAWAVGLMGCLFVVGSLFVGTATAGGAAPSETGDFCGSKYEFGSCAAGDVNINSLDAIPAASDPSCDNKDDTINVQFEIGMENVGGDRYDPAYYVALDGGSGNTGTSCLHGALSANDGVSIDGDSCNDLTAGATTTVTTVEATLKCTDVNEDGFLDAINICSSAKTFGGDSTCNDISEAFASPGSKCECSDVTLATPIPVPPTDPCAEVNCSASGDQCNDGVCVVQSGAAVCVPQPRADSTPCDDGSVCTSETGAEGGPDHCEAGICTGVPVDCSGSDDQCNTGVCNATSGACEADPVADSTPCQDGDACSSETGTAGGADHCSAGVCTGVPVDCSANDDSCNDGVCNAGTGVCEPIAKADSTPCEDGEICTSETGAEGTPDHCEAGICTGVPVDCSANDDSCNTGACNAGTGACEAIPVDDSTPCQDGDACTSETGTAGGPDHCSGGVCTGVPVDCSGSDDQCNTGVCNDTTGACEPIPRDNSTLCDDTQACTDGDVCTDGVCGGTDVDLLVTVTKVVNNDTCIGSDCLSLTSADFRQTVTYNNADSVEVEGDSDGTTITACSGTACVNDGVEVDVTEDLTSQPGGDLDAFYAATFAGDCSDVQLTCEDNRMADCTVTNEQLDLRPGLLVSLRMSALDWSGDVDSLSGSVNIANASSDPDQVATIANLDILLEQRIGKGKNQQWVEIAHPANCTFVPGAPLEIAGSGIGGNQDVTFTCDISGLGLAPRTKLKLTVHAYVDATHVDFFHTTLGGRLSN